MDFIIDMSSHGGKEEFSMGVCVSVRVKLNTTQFYSSLMMFLLIESFVSFKTLRNGLFSQVTFNSEKLCSNEAPFKGLGAKGV